MVKCVSHPIIPCKEVGGGLSTGQQKLLCRISIPPFISCGSPLSLFLPFFCIHSFIFVLLLNLSLSFVCLLWMIMLEIILHLIISCCKAVQEIYHWPASWLEFDNLIGAPSTRISKWLQSLFIDAKMLHLACFEEARAIIVPSTQTQMLHRDVWNEKCTQIPVIACEHEIQKRCLAV